MDAPQLDKAAITKAVREYNAAENSLRRAVDELRAIIPAGVIVLHKRPGAENAAHWTYEGCSALTTGASQPAEIGERLAITLMAVDHLLTCPLCKAQFTYTAEDDNVDLQAAPAERDQRTSAVRLVECPQCKMQVKVHLNQH